MATRPMSAPAAGDELPADLAAVPAGYRICINVAADGQLSVSTEDMPEPAAPVDGMPADPVAAPASMPAADIKEALTMALDEYRSQEEAMGADTGTNAFDAGFFGAPTTPTRGARA